MSSDQSLQLVYGVLVLILVGSALAVRRMKAGAGLKMAWLWLAIFAAIVLLAWVFGARL